MFDYFFRNSVLGNLHQNLFAIDTYVPYYLSEQGFKKEMMALLMKGI